MRILYFSPQDCWPLTSGARLRNYHLATQLASGAQVSWLGMRQPGELAVPLPGGKNTFEAVESVVREKGYSPGKLLRGLIGPDPVTVLNFWSLAVARSLRNILSSRYFDTVQLEGIHLIRYVPVIRACSPGTAIIADWHNIESEIMRRYAGTSTSLSRRIFAARTARLIERAEERLLTICDAHVVASDRERGELGRRAPEARLSTIPNGVDVALYRSGNHRPPSTASMTELLFVGSMDYHANVDGVEWFVREIWPVLTERHPEFALNIVGRDPDPRVRALDAASINVTGTVDDVRPYYSRALAAVVPLRVGSGTRLKILEAMAAGVPVISTRLGAEGLEVADGQHLLLADTPEEFAAAIDRISSDPSLRVHLVEAGYDLVERVYDWRTLGAHLFDVHTETAERRRRALP